MLSRNYVSFIPQVLGTGEINTEDLEKAENVLLRRTFPFTHKEKAGCRRGAASIFAAKF